MGLVSDSGTEVCISPRPIDDGRIERARGPPVESIHCILHAPGRTRTEKGNQFVSAGLLLNFSSVRSPRESMLFQVLIRARRNVLNF